MDKSNTEQKLYGILMCNTCHCEIIITGFADGSFRWLCPCCGLSTYTNINGPYE